jgi:MoaA/NifB/PqqE/SkfB family radical SAM enzyme
MFVPNILITNRCNQNCPFCFAAKEMRSSEIKKEMDYEDYRKLILRLKKGGSHTVIKLLGGEPTMHRDFKKIIDYSLKYFQTIQIFTNGVFSEDLRGFLIGKAPRVKFTFNVMTPGYTASAKIRSIVNENIGSLVGKAEITLSLTIDTHSNVSSTINGIDRSVLGKINIVRIGFANPVAGEDNHYRFRDFSQMGTKLVKMVSLIKNMNANCKFNLNCGFTRCMMTDKQFGYLKKNSTDGLRFGCFDKDADYDIQTDLSAFHCFPLSTMDRQNLKNRSYDAINRNLLQRRFSYWQEFRQNECKNCRIHGIGENKCFGPCLAFLINQERC